MAVAQKERCLILDHWDRWRVASELLDGHYDRAICRGGPDETPGQTPPTFAVVVTAHAPYLRYLEACLDSVDAQTHLPECRAVVLDGCDPPAWLRRREGWRVIRGAWGNPNPARNAGIAATKSSWLVVVDGDNWLDPQYLRSCYQTISTATGRAAIVYSDIQLVDGQGRHVARHVSPERFDYWDLRLANYISTSSAMRRAAVEEAGGWAETTCYDDWGLALRMTANGWTAVRQPVPILAREGADGHRRDRLHADMPFKWTQRSYAIVTLLAGRDDCLSDWLAWLNYAELPERTALYVLDNSRDERFREEVIRALGNPYLRNRLTHIDYQVCNLQCPDLDKPFSRAIHVPRLYNRILPRVSEDMLVTLEDDVIPPLWALKALVRDVPAKSMVGAMAAAYLSRRGAGRIVAAFGPDYIYRRVFRRDLVDGVMKVGCIGGGLTVWHNALVRRSLPFRFEFRNGIPTGWDTILCADMRDAGHVVRLHGGVWCEHRGIDT